MTACAGTSERDDDLIFSVFEQHDLVPDRSGKKIERLDQRLAELKNRKRF
jgi:hypothetical protein